MAETVLTRDTWHRMVRAAYGLTSLAGTVDDLAGHVNNMDLTEREDFHGLTAALLTLSTFVKDTILAMDDENMVDMMLNPKVLPDYHPLPAPLQIDQTEKFRAVWTGIIEEGNQK